MRWIATILAVIMLMCAAANAELSDWVTGFAGGLSEEIAASESTPAEESLNHDGILEQLKTALEGGKEEFTCHYADDFVPDTDIKVCETLIFENGAESFVWKADTQNRVLYISDIVYREDMASSVYAAADNGLTSFVVSLGDDYGKAELLEEMLLNSGYVDYTLSYWNEYRQVQVKAASMRKGFALYEEAKAGGTSDLEKKIAELADGIVKLSDIEKERAINRFICTGFSKDVTPPDGCDSAADFYADVFYAAARLSGLECGYVFGTCNGENRMFNRVRIDGVWCIADVYENDLDHVRQNSDKTINDMISLVYLSSGLNHSYNAEVLPEMPVAGPCGYEMVAADLDEAISYVAGVKSKADTARGADTSIPSEVVVNFAITGNVTQNELERRLENVYSHGSNTKRFYTNVNYVTDWDLTCVDVVIYW